VTSVTDVTKYLIAFSTVPGVGAVRLKLLVNYFGSAEAAWKARETELANVGLPKDVLPQLLEQKVKLNVDQYVENLNDRGINFVTIFDRDYPERLRNIPDPPNVMFFKTGEMYVANRGREQQPTSSLLGEMVAGRTIGVVGTRKITAYGQEVTEKLVAELVVAGFTIVSGMALGVDGVAHGTAVNARGKTVAVLGAGVEVVYPPSHRDLYNSILEHGGIIASEVAPEKTVVRGIFPARNRIISGLSEAVLVTEGAIDSGSLITARAALEQGREVFAVPGPINSPMAEGTNYLLKQGAKLVTGVEDILTELGYETSSNGQAKAGITGKKQVTGDTAEEQKVIDLLANEPVEFDELVRKMAVAPAQLSSVLSMMEIKGMVKGESLKYRLKFDGADKIVR